MENTEKTYTIIRKWGNDYIAIFPHDLGTYSPYTCMSYMHVGQHGSCDPQGIVEQSQNTKNDDSAKLRDFIFELESIGYNLDIHQRIPSNALDIRREKLREFYNN